MGKEWIEKIEQYCNHELSGEEKLRFENELKTNQELLEYYNLYKEVDETLRSEEINRKEEAALLNTLKSLNNRYVNPGVTEIKTPVETKYPAVAELNHRTIKFNYLAAAASIIGIIILSVVIYFSINKKNTTLSSTNVQQPIQPEKDSVVKEQQIVAADTGSNTTTTKVSPEPKNVDLHKLFADNFQPDEPPAEIEGPLEDAFNYYNNHDYSDAYLEFSTADMNTPTRGVQTNLKLNTFYTSYYAGISYLAAKQPSNAIAQLKKALVKSPDSLSVIKTQWYLALAYLKTGSIDMAKQMFEKVAANPVSHSYQSKAEKVLTALQ